MNTGSLRGAGQEDLENLLLWRNQDAVRAWMYNSEIIPENEHRAWYVSMLSDNSKQWLILEWNDQPQAVIYFYDINHKSGFSDWGFYPTPLSMQGVSVLVEYAALKYAFSRMGLRRLQCEVLAANTGVLNLHEKSGFSVEGIRRDARLTERGIEDVYMLAILKDEWDRHEASLYKRLSRLMPFELTFSF